ncbi:MAG: hypothetical protein IJI45_08120 [Anaerolineaceae bacterium]|nr:hypothetical protein [Anaerolineaceae bacterium]
MKQPVDQQTPQSEAQVTIIPAASSTTVQPFDQQHVVETGGEVVVLPAAKRETVCVAAYCRVSTDLEEQEGSLEAQIAHWTEVVSTHGGG